MAPLTRYRATEEHVPTTSMKEYYSQRGSTPGTLLITEATLIAQKAGGSAHVPGIWSKEQIKAWKEASPVYSMYWSPSLTLQQITDAVHANGSFIYVQIWAIGRAASVSQLHAEDPTLPFVSASDIPLPEAPTPAPRPLTIDEIHEYATLYATAASNAIAAGFDGVEMHGANGYLVRFGTSFFHTRRLKCQRTDRSIPPRCVK